ncbi:MAG: NAD(+) synthase [Porcipelethomonas sp.]
MNDGFIKVACATPDLKVADCLYNSRKIIEMIKTADSSGVKVCVFPELSITGYTCGDLFFQTALLDAAKTALKNIIEAAKECETVFSVGLPFSHEGKIYNCAAVCCKGKLIGLVPKKNIPNYSEFYEARHFTPGIKSGTADFFGEKINIGTDCIFKCREMQDLIFGVEICEDLWVGDSPSVNLAKQGASLILNLSASNEVIGKADYRRIIVRAKSGSLLCVYAYANAGIGESTTDMVYSGHSIISENGAVSAESNMFEHGMIMFDADLKKINSERRRSNTFQNAEKTPENSFTEIEFSLRPEKTKLGNYISPAPFVPQNPNELEERCNEIFSLQATGLMTRLRHTGCKNAVIGLSGGLDSTLALIVTVRAFKMLGLDTKGIRAITMPCFGTTDRTYTNACRLAGAYGAELREINIRESVRLHFSDIGHDESVHDVTYENGQARERTQILMDIANQCSGMVIGTGDLSELALGWATYNGDHMSMYAVNASIPKTLVRYLVSYEAQNQEEPLKEILLDILETPVSPELLPPDENGTISQKTEDLVGPYELHDFFLFYMLRFGFSPSKIFRIAMKAFDGVYDRETILKWEKIFYRRFFSQQFKRSCLPDGPKVGTVTLSPRSDFRMPSDASAVVWMKELEEL